MYKNKTLLVKEIEKEYMKVGKKISKSNFYCEKEVRVGFFYLFSPLLTKIEGSKHTNCSNRKLES